MGTILRPPRPTRSVVVAVAVACLVAACQSDSSENASASSSPTGSGVSASGSDQSSPAAGSTASAVPSQTGISRCSADRLALSTAESSEGSAAGHQALAIVFSNASGTPCTIYGYPGVSFVTGESGAQVNNAATRRTSSTPSTVTLAAQGTAEASLLLSRADFYDESACQPTEVPGLRVYPPDETTPMFVSVALTVCSVAGTGVPEIGPVTARS